MKEGQLYRVENSKVTGIIDTITDDKVKLRRLTDNLGLKITPFPVTLARESIENSIQTGHIILGSGKDDPNTAFRLRKINEGRPTHNYDAR